MAYKESGELGVSEIYVLGAYTFTIQNVVSEGERVIQAHVAGPEGSAAQGITVPTSMQLLGWYVEANESEATVYALVKPTAYPPLVNGDLNYLEMSDGQREQTGSYNSNKTKCFITAQENIKITRYGNAPYGSYLIAAMPYSASAYSLFSTYIESPGGGKGSGTSPQYVTFAGEKVVFSTSGTYISFGNKQYDLCNLGIPPTSDVTARSGGNYTMHERIAWSLVYSTVEAEEEERLIARFAININDAGGTGSDSDWTDPDDYNIDPYKKLIVNITGATSGTHNDPAGNSFSYIPNNNLTEKTYGCGGDGGYGGGGGAGSATVIVQQFATDKANSKEINVTIQPPGYGSGGGKGGEGGDGCILVFW